MSSRGRHFGSNLHPANRFHPSDFLGFDPGVPIVPAFFFTVFAIIVAIQFQRYKDKIDLNFIARLLAILSGTVSVVALLVRYFLSYV
jgi:hypothetical protein